MHHAISRREKQNGLEKELMDEKQELYLKFLDLVVVFFKSDVCVPGVLELVSSFLRSRRLISST
jgi:hypothetical protein